MIKDCIIKTMDSKPLFKASDPCKRNKSRFPSCASYIRINSMMQRTEAADKMDMLLIVMLITFNVSYCHVSLGRKIGETGGCPMFVNPSIFKTRQIFAVNIKRKMKEGRGGGEKREGLVGEFQQVISGFFLSLFWKCIYCMHRYNWAMPMEKQRETGGRGERLNIYFLPRKEVSRAITLSRLTPFC